jgi:integrase
MLNDTQIRNAKQLGKLTDGKGLYLEVRPTGAKLWRYRYKMQQNGQSVEYLYALGEHCKAPEVETPKQAAARRAAGLFTLEEARTERLRLRGLVKQGIHPKADRDARITTNRDAQASTFEAVAREWIGKRSSKWSASRTSKITRFLQNDVFGEIGQLPIRVVTPAHLLAIVERVEKRAPNVAYCLRQWSGAIFRYAMSKLLVDGDPTAALGGAIELPATKHHKPLTPAQIPEFVEKLGQSETLTATALRLLLLTFTRPTELTAAQWAEIDLDGAEWRIRAERMKGKREHCVPLSLQAVAALRKLHAKTGDGDYLFPNYRKAKTHMSPSTLNSVLADMGYAGKFSAHGFRATASTQLNEMNYRPDVIEAQLAHKERDQTRGAYNRAQYLPERTKMMQDWADHIDALASGAKVTPIRQGNAA